MLQLNQLTGFWFAPAGDTDVLGGAALILGEAAGMGIDFTYHSDINKQVKIRGTGAYYGSAYGKLTYTSPAIKLCRQADGVWRYSNHNICLQSQNLGTTWANTKTTETTDTTTAPDGTSTADSLDEDGTAASTHIIIQDVAGIVAGGQYQVSGYFKAANRTWVRVQANTTGFANGWSAFLNLSTGALGTNAAGGSGVLTSCTVTDAGNGWYRFVMVGIIDTSATAMRITISIAEGNGDAVFDGLTQASIYCWGMEVKRYPAQEASGVAGYLATTTAAVYDLPFEWDIGGNSLGILVEEQRQNVCLRSQDLTTTWANSGTTEASNSTTAPDGTTTADTLIEDGASSRHTLYQSLSISGAVTFSVFVKATGAGSTRYAHLVITDFAGGILRATYSLLSGGSVTATGAAGTASYTSSSITDAGNGWYRIALSGSVPGSSYVNLELANSGTPTLTGDGEATYAGDSTSGLYYWGAQAEQGAFPTSPIHTVAASVTRAADTITLLNSAYPYSTLAGTMVASFSSESTVNSINRAILLLGSEGSGTPHLIRTFGGGGSQRIVEFAIWGDGGSLTDTGALSASSGAGFHKVGAGYASGDSAIVLDGGSAVANADAFTIGNNVTTQFGCSAVFTSLNGYLRQITYLPRRATNSELQTRTNDGPGASDLLLGENEGLSFDFTYTDVTRQARIKDNTTGANNYHSSPQAKLTYTSPSLKLTRQSDGVWRYGNHNLHTRAEVLGSWTALQGSTQSANTTTDPNRGATADTLVEDGSGGNNHRALHTITLAASFPCTMSIYAKATGVGSTRYPVLILTTGSTNVYVAAIFDLSGGGSVSKTQAGSSGTYIASSITSVGNGWFRCSLTGLVTAANPFFAAALATSATHTIDSDGQTLYNGDSTSGMYWWGAQAKRYPVNDAGGLTPSTGYLTTSGSVVYDLPYEWSAAGVPQGILIEEARQNLCLRSQDFSTTWGAAAGAGIATITANSTVAPDGTTTADTLADNDGAAYKGMGQTMPSNATAAVWTASVFVKKDATGRATRFGLLSLNSNSGNVYDCAFDTATGETSAALSPLAPAAFGTIDCGDYWRVYVAGTMAVATPIINLYPAAGASSTFAAYSVAAQGSIIAWGVQLEPGTFATSPIHTAGATVTRLGDQITLPMSSFPYNASAANTFVGETGSVRFVPTQSPRVLGFPTGRTPMAAQDATNSLWYDGTDFPSAANATFTSTNKCAIGYDEGLTNASMCNNGGTIVASALANFGSPTTLALGMNNGSIDFLNGYIRKVTQLKRRATNVELQSKTS